jgi:hypothetical protein
LSFLGGPQQTLACGRRPKPIRAPDRIAARGETLPTSGINVENSKTTTFTIKLFLHESPSFEELYSYHYYSKLHLCYIPQVLGLEEEFLARWVGAAAYPLHQQLCQGKRFLALMFQATITSLT